MAQAVNAGYRTYIKNLVVDTMTWTALDLPFVPNNLCIRLREAGDLKVSLDAVGTEYFTIPNGTSLTYDWNAGKKTGVIYLQGSVAGTAEIIATFEG